VILVAVGAGAYAWTEAEGLDAAAVLEAGAMIGRLAKGYIRKAQAVGAGRDDLVQAGYVGALRAARTYRPDRGMGFLGWAANRARDEMRRLMKPRLALSLDALRESGWDAAEEDASLGTALDAMDAAAALRGLAPAVRAALAGGGAPKKAALAAARRAMGVKKARPKEDDAMRLCEKERQRARAAGHADWRDAELQRKREAAAARRREVAEAKMLREAAKGLPLDFEGDGAA
jgi:hypothetical protein